MKDLVYYHNEMDQLYRDDSGPRWASFRMAMNLFIQLNGKRIVETGCARLEGDWGGGLSTLLFGDLCKRLNNGAHLWTVDSSAENIGVCQGITRDYKNFITYNIGNSIEFLQSLDIGGLIDLLYLDSCDYPYRELLNLYGGEQDIMAAKAILMEMSEQEIAEKHSDLIQGSQEHCVNELNAALPYCHDEAIILIDDNMLAGGGKPRLAKEILLDRNYICLYDWQQTLWIKWK